MRLARGLASLTVEFVLEALSVDEVHDEEEAAVLLEEVADSRDVRVLQFSKDGHLCFKAVAQVFVVVVAEVVHLFDGTGTVSEGLVSSEVDGTHATNFEGALNLVALVKKGLGREFGVEHLEWGEFDFGGALTFEGRILGDERC